MVLISSRSLFDLENFGAYNTGIIFGERSGFLHRFVRGHLFTFKAFKLVLDDRVEAEVDLSRRLLTTCSSHIFELGNVFTI